MSRERKYQAKISLGYKEYNLHEKKSIVFFCSFFKKNYIFKAILTSIQISFIYY